MMREVRPESQPTRHRALTVRLLRTVAAGLVSAAIVGCSSGSQSPSEPTAAPPPSTPTFGYAGPSVVTRIALGVTESYPAFRAWDGATLVRLNGFGFDGCDVARWAGMRGSGDYCWNNFEQMLAANPGTDRILFMVGFKPGFVLTVEQTRAVALELQEVCGAQGGAGACTLLISGLPDYINTCGEMPVNGIPGSTRSVADSVAAGAASFVPGPLFSAVAEYDVTDGCHQNQLKRAEHADELVSFLGE